MTAPKQGRVQIIVDAEIVRRLQEYYEAYDEGDPKL